MPFGTPIAFYDAGAARQEWRGNLPHLVQSNCVYFVTMHLSDSVPLHVQRKWALEILRWEESNPLPHSPAQREAHAELQYRQRERWLDRGTGSCALANARCQDIVEGVLRRFDGERLSLGDYNIMPNHLHSLVVLPPNDGLKAITDAWRLTSTRLINAAIGRSGRFWHRDPFDHIVRDPQSLSRIRDYIRQNGEHLPADRYRKGCGSLFGPEK